VELMWCILEPEFCPTSSRSPTEPGPSRPGWPRSHATFLFFDSTSGHCRRLLAIVPLQARQHRRSTFNPWRKRNPLDDDPDHTISWLITHKRFKLHRRLGRVTLVVLAPLLVASGLHMVQLMVLRDKEFEVILLLEFAFLDLCALTLFVTFLVLAVLKIPRNDSDAHARYMAGTVLFAMEPAVERIFVFYVPGVSGFASALYFALITMELIVLVLLYFEWQRHRVRLPFCLALGFFVAMHVFMTPVANSVAFTSFARWFARL
jgi:hypothetical protein